jgi:hypothetical protein
VSLPFQHQDIQRCDEPRSFPSFLYRGHNSWTSSLSVTSPRRNILHQTFRIRAATVCRLLGFAYPRGSTFLHLVCGGRFSTESTRVPCKLSRTSCAEEALKQSARRAISQSCQRRSRA